MLCQNKVYADATGALLGTFIMTKYFCTIIYNLQMETIKYVSDLAKQVSNRPYSLKRIPLLHYGSCSFLLPNLL